MEGLTVAHLRQRARHYRTLADKDKHPERSALYREIADVLDREADAIRDDEARGNAGHDDSRPQRAD